MFINSYIKLGPNGVLPTRAHPTDTGYDVTLVSKKPYNWGPNIEVYGTDIYLQTTTSDYYFEIVPRSSIVKTPYMLANSVGIIDVSYTGELLVVLRKMDTEAPGLTLPAKIVQLIPRARLEVNFILKMELQETDRSDGGFGSTTTPRSNK
jgi:dUTP pyrophosphatase